MDVFSHGGHAYPGMEGVYHVELQQLDDSMLANIPDHKFPHAMSPMDYPTHPSTPGLQSQVRGTMLQPCRTDSYMLGVFDYRVVIFLWCDSVDGK